MSKLNASHLLEIQGWKIIPLLIFLFWAILMFIFGNLYSVSSSLVLIDILLIGLITFQWTWLYYTFVNWRLFSSSSWKLWLILITECTIIIWFIGIVLGYTFEEISNWEQILLQNIGFSLMFFWIPFGFLLSIISMFILKDFNLVVKQIFKKNFLWISFLALVFILILSYLWPWMSG